MSDDKSISTALGRNDPLKLHGPATRESWVVLGMHRSGTSLMARLLQLSGGRLPNDLMPPSEANMLGYSESISIRSLNDEILAAADTDWDEVFVGLPRPYLSDFDHDFRRRVAGVLRSAFGDEGPIVLKDPRINVLAEFWDVALKAAGFRPSYLIMVRHPQEVAASLLARDNMPLEHGLMLWLDYMIAAERGTRGASRVFVAYDDLLADWRVVLDRVEQAWGHPLPRRTAVAAAEISRFIRPDLRHHTSPRDASAGNTPMPPLTLAVYEWFMASRNQQLFAGHEVLDRAAEWLESLREQLQPLMTYQKLHLLELRTQLKEYVQHSRALEEAREALHAELSQMRQAYDVCAAEMTEVRAAKDVKSAELQQTRAENEARSVELDQVRAASATCVSELKAVLEIAASRELALRASFRASEAQRVAQQAATDRLEAQCAELSGMLEMERQQLRDVKAAQHQTAQGMRQEFEGQFLARDFAPANFEEELQKSEARYCVLSDELRRVQAVAEAASIRGRDLEYELTAVRRASCEDRADYERTIANWQEAEQGRAHNAAVEAQKSLEAEREASSLERRYRKHAEAQAQTLKADMTQLELDFRAAQRENDVLRAERMAVLSSTTWRLTAAARHVVGGLRRR